MVFESPEVADKVVSSKHTIDRREVEAKRAVPKDETQASQTAADASQKTRKIFVGGLAPTVDDQVRPCQHMGVAMGTAVAENKQVVC